MIDKITNTIERFSNKIMDTERVLRAEMEARLAEEVAKRERIMEESYRKEKEHLETELRDLKTMMTKQLDEERQLMREDRAMLEQMRVDNNTFIM